MPVKFHTDTIIITPTLDSKNKFSSITLPLTLNEFHRSVYDIYWSWISGIYRGKTYYS